MIQIIIPTLARCDKQITLKNIPEKFHEQVTLVVQEHEYEYMKNKYTNTNVFCLPSNTKGIAKTRQIIGKEWQGKNIFIFDDDLDFVTSIYDAETDTFERRKINENDFSILLDQVEEYMDNGYIHGGLSATNIPPVKEKVSFNSRIWTNVFYSKDFNPDSVDWGIDYEMFPEDFYINLQLLTSGYPNVLFNWIRVSPSSTNSEGGCETYRTIENHNRGQELLKEKFPEFVTVYDKKQKSGNWKGLTKKALRIYWKKAYESYKKENDLENIF